MFDFDLSNGYVVLRILCGLFLIPHAWAKVFTRQGPLGFFTAAGYPNPGFFVSFGLVFETVFGLGLIFGVYTVLSAWMTAAFLLVASASVYKLTKKWSWNLGGCEYPLFWALVCVVVALHSHN
jgi:putative oxidoreductase